MNARVVPLLVAAALSAAVSAAPVRKPAKKPAPARPRPARPAPAPPAPVPPEMPKTANEQLFEAIEKGDAAAVKALLAAGASATAESEEGVPAIVAAASGSSVEICLALLDRGAPVNGIEGELPLEAAAIEGNLEIVRLLLDRGADPNAKCDYEHTALSAAVSNNHPEVVSLLLDRGAGMDSSLIWTAHEQDAGDALARLLERGADVNHRDEEIEGTLLMHAAAYGELELLELLLKHKADVNLKDRNGRSALKHASGEHRLKIRELLKQAGAREFEPTMMEAALQGDTRSLRIMLRRGEDANSRDPEGRTPLFAAAESGSAPIAVALLEMGANPNAKDRSGRSVARAALAAGKREIAELLVEHGADVPELELIDGLVGANLDKVRAALEAGADPNAVDDTRKPIWMRALAENLFDRPEEVLRLLLEKGARPNPAPEDTWHPLPDAAASGNAALVKELLDRGAVPAGREGLLALWMVEGAQADDIAKLLLEKGAPVYLPEHKDVAPLAGIARSCSVEVLRLALDRAGSDAKAVNARDAGGATALYRAAETGDVASLKLLLERGADPNVPGEMGTPVLIAAVQAEELESVQLLIKAGAKVNARDEDGFSALHFAELSGNREIAQELRKAGAVKSGPAAPTPRSKPDPAGPLWEAVMSRNLKAVDLLLTRKKVSPNVVDSEGSTPLHLAVLQENLPLVRLLLARGARPDYSPQGRPQPHERSVLVTAVETGNLEIVRLLLKYKADVNRVSAGGETALIVAARNNDYTLASALIDAGARVNAEPVRGSTAILHAAEHADNLLLRLLIRKGARQDVTDADGDTPLFRAARAGNPSGVRFLISSGSDPKKTIVTGETSLIAAVEGGNLEVIQLLISKGVDLNAVDQWNRTALSLAEDMGNGEIIELLERSGAKL